MIPYYESPRGVAEYLLLHYGTPAQVSPVLPPPPGSLGFPARCVAALLDPARLPPDARALELGCAVGRAAFELAASCARVLATDLSHAFIQAAQRLAADGSLHAEVPAEGERTVRMRFEVPRELPRGRVRFAVASALDPDPEPGPFHAILAANLLCRLPDPGALLDRLAGLLPPGGQLLLTTPGTWLEEYTPRARWLGGTAAASTREALHRRLETAFTLDAETDLPFLIREHERKFQWGIAWGTRWIRRP